MTRKRHIYGINFILWLSFIAFAAVIIFLTWIFQTMLLRVFFGADMTKELTSVGDKAYGDIGFLMGIPGGEDEINRYLVQVMNENDLVTAYLLDNSGNILYPTEVIDPDGYGLVAEPDTAVFRRAVAYLDEAIEDGFLSLPCKAQDYYFLRLFRIGLSENTVPRGQNPASREMVQFE